jgi:nucleoside-diphosphate-sugar epimerase
MKVLVTGGAGHVGKATTERLVRQGWDVRVIGLESGVEMPGAEFATCDILNYDDLRQQMRGCQAVVHLAAFASPRVAPGHTLFQTNVSGTFNVFEAAAAEGIRRVVQASSINALGCAWSITDITPRYFPIDEEHPSMTNDPYSFSKQLVEDIARYYWRRDGISSASMRFPWVTPAAYVETERYRQQREGGRQVLAELAALPDAERERRLADARRRALEFRSQRPMEFDGKTIELPRREATDDKLWYAYTMDRFNFWAIVDARDAAQSFEKALTAEYDGAHALFVSDDHNWLGAESRTLVRWFFREVPASKIALSGSEALISIEKARALIGFAPEYSVDAVFRSGATS